MADARKLKALSDAEVLAMTDEEVFGPSEPTPSPPAHKVDMEGVVKAIGMLAQTMQESSAADRAAILARVSALQAQSNKDALKAVSDAGSREVKVEVKAPEAAKAPAKAGTYFEIVRDVAGDMVGIIATPLEDQLPKSALEAARRAAKRN